MVQLDAISGERGGYAQVNDMRMYYAEYGSGEPLVLAHGGTLTHESWAPQIPAFTQHFRIIAPDGRSQGHTGNPTRTLSYRLMADDMAAFIVTTQHHSTRW